ncbi:MAG: carboxylate-amine ligase [Rhodobacteraceae bacterium]|nr:carboxylate-amine ligase [Paracoccaceae bacterium]
MKPSLRLGIEEEYLIVDQETLDLVREPVPELIEECQKECGNQVTNEYLQCQIEVGTPPCTSIAESGRELARLRKLVTAKASEFGYAIIAASTHPFSSWREQSVTQKERYQALNTDLGHGADRLLICGMHIHIEIEDPDLRIDLMKQATYFLPHMLALSCSSPFWEGYDTSMASYRLGVFDSLPRTGIPDPLQSYADYQSLVDQLVGTGCIEDATKLWWDMRPSAKFPTLEQRITDICSCLDDTLAIAALYQSLILFLYRLRSQNQQWRQYPSTLVSENRWRARRFGCTGSLIDLGISKTVPFAKLADELVVLLYDDACNLECEHDLVHIRTIVEKGSSADRQREVYTSARKAGASHDEALRAIVTLLKDNFLDFMEPDRRPLKEITEPQRCG